MSTPNVSSIRSQRHCQIPEALRIALPGPRRLLTGSHIEQPRLTFVVLLVRLCVEIINIDEEGHQSCRCPLRAGLTSALLFQQGDSPLNPGYEPSSLHVDPRKRWDHLQETVREKGTT